MHPAVKAALACAVLAAIGARAGVAARPRPAVASPTATAAPSLQQMPCPPRHLPEGDVCVPLLSPEEPLARDTEVQRERRPRGRSFEVLPRRPDRPEDPRAFRYPIPSPPLILRGFDDVASQPTDVSPVSVELSAERGTPAQALRLAGQEEKTKVVASDRLIGNTVVTAHVVREGDRVRTYLLVYGRLDAAGPDVKVGATLEDGQTVGFVGDSGSPGVVRLYLEARRLREEATLDGLDIKALTDSATSVATDLRNVLSELEGKNGAASP